ncbi:MAG: toll/interleukin-1 receptor domain-containing protein [Blastocatellia bacterium]|nr:toll/interleukin-1 receptor domain-containing protein [Blastocatellia bacterium]
MEEPKAKMVMIYAHKDRKFLNRSGFLGFLEGLARRDNLDFWWDEKMSHPLFDEEIKRQLDEAEIIVCLVSQEFLNSDYVRNVEAKTANKRLRDEGILVVPIMLSASPWKYEEWLKDIHHFPQAGYLHNSSRKNEIFLEITEYISAWYRKSRARPFRDPEMIYKLRRLPETSLSKEQIRILQKDSCDRARKMVPNPDLREKICRDARSEIEKNKGAPLKKELLEDLDEKFLALGLRNRDAKIVRWVLRCEGLHPQGRVPKRRA